MSQNPEILSRGQYIEQVDTLLKLYGRKDILFLFYEDLQSNEREYIKRVYEFLGVDATFRPDVIGNPVRASMLPRFRRTLRRMGLTPLVNIVNRSIAGDLIRRILITSRRAKAEPQTKPLKPDRKLYAHFAPYNERLSRTLNCNLDHWTLSETND